MERREPEVLRFLRSCAQPSDFSQVGARVQDLSGGLLGNQCRGRPADNAPWILEMRITQIYSDPIPKVAT